MVRFELRLGKGEYGALQVRIVGKGINTKVSTGVKLKPKEWVAEAQTLKHPNDVRKQVSLGGLSYAAINDKLQELRRALDAIDARGELSVNVVKACIAEILKDKSASINYSEGGFVAYAEKYVEDMKSGRVLMKKTKDRFEEYYWQQYVSMIKHLKGYEEWADMKIGWGSLTISFYDKFCFYLKQVQGLKQNTVANYTVRLQAVVRSALRKKLVTCDVDLEEWQTITVRPEGVYLSNEKLTELYNMDFQDEARVAELVEAAAPKDKEYVKKQLNTHYRRWTLQNAANIFLIGCLSGQRISDIPKVCMENMVKLRDGKDYVKIKQKKTKKTVFVPVSKRLDDVMQRKITMKTNRCLEDYLKRIGRIMGWNEVPNIQEEISGIMVQTKRPFYEFLTTHTGRRTFATLAYQRGISIASIMAVTGHKQESTLRRYLKLDEEETAMMASAELFKISAESTKVVVG